MTLKEIKIPNGWQLKNISQIGKVKGGGTPDTKNADYWNGDILWATPTDITNLKGKYIIDTERKITKLGLEKSSAKSLPVNSLLMTSRASIGFCAINKKEISTNQGFQNIIPNSKVDIEFLYYLIQSSYVQKQLLNKAYGSTFLEIPNRDVKKVKFLLPNLNEQVKIADILANVDEILFYTQEIIDQLQLSKKGLMQRLFTEGIGHVEFKETRLGKIPKEWDVLKMNECVQEIISGDWGEKEIGYGLSKCRVIRGTDFPDVFYSDFDNVPIRYVTSEKLKKTKLKVGDLLIEISGGSKDQPTGRIIRINESILENNDEEVFFTNFVKLLRLRSALISNFFYYYYWLYLYKRNKTTTYEIRTSNIRNFRFKEFLKFVRIPLPKLNEQLKIVKIIKNIDDKIENELRYVKKLKIIKKGLMQGLLTGKRRVKIN